MRNLLILLLLTLTTGVGYSQSIKGVVSDAEGPLEFASVRLFSADSSVVTGIYTDEKGAFSLKGFDPGSYYIVVTFTNFSAYQTKTLDMTKSKDLDLGAIKMEIDKTIEFEGVVAVGSLDVLKAGIDKKVYNVQDDIAVKGGTVNDVLNNIPSIDIDQDGNISLRGDGNVTVLIDGRPSGLVLGDGQNLLDALPANSIERVEVVTNPSAKYDPDGTSGIINIVMKKNKLKGFNGIISATAGAATLTTGQQYETNFALSYRNKRLNLYTNYSYNHFRGYRNYSSLLEREIIDDSTIVLDQRRDGTDLKEGNTFLLGADFFINDYHSIGVSGTATSGYRKRTGDLHNLLYDGDSSIVNNWDRLSEDPRVNKNLDFNLNYSWKLKEDKGELSAVGYQSYGSRDIQGNYQEFYYDEFGNANGLNPLNQRLQNDQLNKLTTAQVDFNYILKDIRARFETGAKAIIRSEDISTFSETQDTITGLFAEDTVANYDYTFNGGVYSVYGIFGQELGKFKYQGGVRGEYAIQDPILVGDATNYTKTYINVFPSAHIKYEFNKKSELGLSYSKRINRPRSRQLNPFTSYADPFNLRSGNPDLEPEFIDSYDLSYSFTTKKFIFSSSIFHRRTKDVINRVKLYRDNNTAIVTYDNIDKSESTGFEAVVIYKPFKWWKNTVSFNANYINYTNLDPDTDWNNDGVNWSMKYIGSVDFWKKTASLQVNAAYRAPRVTPQGIVQPRTGIDISVEKRMFNKQLSIGARATDIFNTKGFNLELVQDGVRQVSDYKWLTRRFFLTVSYKFGNYDKKRMPRSSGDGGGGM